MNFTKYQHVERLGTTETDGILDGIDKVKETMSEIF